MKLHIKIDEIEYEAEIEVVEEETQRPAAAHVAAPRSTTAAPPPTAAPQGTASAADQANVKGCRSGVVGIVVKVLAEVGQAVQPGDPLLVLEAMKMESNVTAPFAGKVKAIPVKQGDGVTKGQLLVELE